MNRVCLAALMTALLPMSAFAQTGADFYKGKVVTYIVATAPGGGYDAYGRLVTEYMQKHLPGTTFVVKNVPGAGHLIGANAIYASKPDGLTIGSFNTGLIYNQLVKHEGVKFDLAKLTWIGKASSDPRVIVMTTQSKITNFAELKASATPINFATSGLGSANHVEITMLTNILKLPIKLLSGYNGNEDQLAMRRGEVGGGLGSRSSYEQFVKNGYGRFITQIGGKETDVPQLSTLVTGDEAKALLNLVGSQAEIARLTVGPPAIPADRAAALRDAYRKSLEDPELQARALKLERPVEASYGDDALKLIQGALEQPPGLIEELKKALTAIPKGEK